jgi:hypothetical protein
MARIPIPRRGVRSIFLLAIVAYLGYRLLRRLTATVEPEDDGYDNPYRAAPKGKTGGKSYPPLHPDELDPALALGTKQKQKVMPLEPKAPVADGAKAKKTKAREQLPQHKYLPNGLLQVNPKGQHPIYDLLAKGKEVWGGKLERASTTLGQAVDEYRRRYGRAPPKGFDRW